MDTNDFRKFMTIMLTIIAIMVLYSFTIQYLTAPKNNQVPTYYSYNLECPPHQVIHVDANSDNLSFKDQVALKVMEQFLIQEFVAGQVPTDSKDLLKRMERVSKMGYNAADQMSKYRRK